MKSKYLQGAWLGGVLLLLYLPVFLLAVYSLTDAEMIGQKAHFSLQNYKTLLTFPEMREMIIGTILWR